MSSNEPSGSQPNTGVDMEKLKEMVVGGYMLEMQAEGYYPGSRIPKVQAKARSPEHEYVGSTSTTALPLTSSVSRVPICKLKDNTFHRRALGRDEIRILRVSDGTDQDPVVCTTSYEKLDQPPTYVALSYSWGYVDVTHPITLDGEDFLVSKAVHTALKSLRRQAILESCDRNLWVDAICINQEDVKEKTHQVRMMSKIYKHATLVVAWLGEMTNKDRRGFNLIANITKKLQLENIYAHDGVQIISEHLTHTTDLAEQIGIPYMGHRLWEDVHHLFQKPW